MFGEQVWAPTLFTPPLCEDFPTDGDRLLQLVDLAWASPESEAFRLDEWQRALIRHVLERFPDDHPKYPGRLRYRQVVISMGRQNGKSVLGAILALYGLLLHTRGPEVIGVAYSVEQANIVYDRVRHVIQTNPAFAKRFKATGTRGIRSRSELAPGSYKVKAGAEASLQGVPVSLALRDEVHLTPEESWDATVLGTSARPEAVVVGITTAGDDNSVLLKRLYETGKQSVAGGNDADERFGFFLWEAPAHLPVGHPDALKAANPAIACGRMDLDQEVNAVKQMPENQARRYRHNLFVSSASSWMPVSNWFALPKGHAPDAAQRRVVFAVDRAENWTYATVTAAVKVGDRVFTEVVASIPNPTHDGLEELLMDLHRRFKPLKVFMRAVVLRDLALALRDRGVAVEYLTTTQVQNACAIAYSLIAEGRVTHADDPLVNTQMPRAVAKNTGEAWAISPRHSVGEVDAVFATVLGLYGAEITKPAAPAIYVG